MNDDGRNRLGYWTPIVLSLGTLAYSFGVQGQQVQQNRADSDMTQSVLAFIGSIATMLAILSGPFIALAAIKVHDIARKEGWL